jgi:hypothetical protein
LPVKEG